jgi:RNA repair, ligase-Pnkp-associating, region of Hen1
MLLTITTTQPPATDLSRLLLADPDDVRTCRFAFGEAMVFFPQHDSARCTAAVLVQTLSEGSAPPLASLAVAVATVFEPAIRHVADSPVESEEQPRHYEVQAPSLPGGGHEHTAHRLFAPLGYDVDFGADGSLWLSGTTDLASLLTHLCVLLPVLEGARLPGGHEVVERLLAGAGGWLAAHPEYGYIAGQQPELSVGAEPVVARHRRHVLRMCTRHLST